MGAWFLDSELSICFDNIIKSVRRMVSHLDAASKAIHQMILLYNNVVIVHSGAKANTIVGLKANTAVFIKQLQF